jgi:RNA polymerase sigma factor (sigma-70 family)
MNDALTDYLRAIDKTPLLTADEEIKLSREVQAAAGIENPVTKEDKRIVAIGRRAKNKMIEANLKLVVSVAKKHQNQYHSLELLDLIQEGSLGLNHAVGKFDSTRGYKFSTYAWFWIRDYIQRGIKKRGLPIALPKAVKDNLIQVAKAREEFTSANGRGPSYRELADQMGKTVKWLTDTLGQARYVGSLDAPLGQSGAVADLLADPATADPDRYLSQLSDQQEVERLLADLPKVLDATSIDVLLSRNGEQIESWREIQRRTGLSRAALQDMEDRAKSRCRRLLAGLPAPSPPVTKNEPAIQATLGV